MHRPLIWFSAAFAVGCGLAFLSLSIPLALTAILLIIGIVIGKRFPAAGPLIAMLSGILCGLSYTQAYHTYIVEPIQLLDGQSIHGTVTASDFAVRYEENQRIEVSVNGEEVGCPKNFKTLLYLPLTEKDILPGDTITGKLEFYRSSMREGFDRESYYRSKGYFVLASIKNTDTMTIKPPETRPLSYYPKQLAQDLHTVFAQLGTDRQSAFWNALITGDRTGLTIKDKDHLRKAGLSHVIAVSGLHVGVLISFLLLVCGRKIGTVLGIPVLIGFYCMVGWSPSIVRACIMYGILLLSFWLKTETDSINSMFAALLVILIVLPDTLLSVSLQLSFAATFGILCTASHIQSMFALPKKTPKIVKKVYAVCIGSIACTAGSMLFTTPILLYHFGYLSVFSVLSNFLALWAVSLLFPLLAISGIVGLFSIPIADTFMIPVRALTDYVYHIVDETAALPYGILYQEQDTDLIFATAFCLLMAFILWKGKRWMVLCGVPLLITVFIGISIWRGTQAQNDWHISIFSEDRGQSILVSCGDQTALIDCAGTGHHHVVQDIEAHLDWRGIDTLDMVILTSIDRTHARNICELLHTIPVDQVVLPEVNRENKEPYPQLMASLESQHIPYTKIAPETEIPIGDASLGISVLGNIPRKLAVRMRSEDQDILTVHALTQNMLLALTDEQELTCETLITSYGFCEDPEERKELLRRIHPKQIVLLSGWDSADVWDDIPIINPYITGQIDWRTVRD